MQPITILGDHFIQNGVPARILAGAMHYFRIMPTYWRDRLTKLKAMGLNTVETYVAWNLHEPRPGQFDFTGQLDLAITELRRAHPHLPIVLRVRRSNTRAIACYRRVGFTVIGSGCKSLPSGEAVPYYRMVLPTLRQKPRRCLASPQLSASIRRALGLQ